MLDVAVLLASKRNSIHTIDTVRIAANNSKYSWKIFLHGTHDSADGSPDVEFIPETNPQGVVQAYNYLAKLTAKESEFVITISDGMCMRPDSFSIIEELRELRDTDPSLVVRGFGVNDMSDVCDLPEYSGLWGKAHIVRYACFERASLDRDFAGHICNPHFKYHAVDNWLGAYCYLMGRTAHESTKAMIDHCEHHGYDDTHDAYDRLVLEKLCKGFDKETNNSYIAEPKF